MTRTDTDAALIARPAAEDGQLVAETKQPYAYTPDGSSWRAAMLAVLAKLPQQVKAHIQTVAVDGTSSTALLVDGRTGRMLAPPKMYFESQSAEAVEAVRVSSSLSSLRRFADGKCQHNSMQISPLLALPLDLKNPELMCTPICFVHISLR